MFFLPFLFSDSTLFLCDVNLNHYAFSLFDHHQYPFSYSYFFPSVFHQYCFPPSLDLFSHPSDIFFPPSSASYLLFSHSILFPLLLFLNTLSHPFSFSFSPWLTSSFFFTFLLEVEDLRRWESGQHYTPISGPLRFRARWKVS